MKAGPVSPPYHLLKSPVALVEAAEEARRIEKHVIAMMRAEIALSQASELRRESLADTIAQAEVEVLEETEAILDSEYKLSCQLSRLQLTLRSRDGRFFVLKVIQS